MQIIYETDSVASKVRLGGEKETMTVEGMIKIVYDLQKKGRGTVAGASLNSVKDLG